MKFLAVLIAAIFLSASTLAETSPVSSKFAAASKAARVSSRVRKVGPGVCPHQGGMTNAERGAALVAPNVQGLVATRIIVPSIGINAWLFA
jgi:hypothetical protein